MYESHLKNLLRPLGIYALDEGIGAAELKADGLGLDGISDILESAEAESCVARALGEGLELWENILPVGYISSSLKKRREAIMALMRISNGAYTVELLNSTLAGCGIAAEVAETGERQCVKVSFPGKKGVPEDVEEIKKGVEMILPCHLGIEYVYVYPTWQEIENLILSWQRAEELWRSWDAAEKAGDEDGVSA